MTYESFEPRVFPLLIYYIGLAIFSVVLTLKMVAKWKERKVQPPLLMAFIFGIITAALAMMSAGLADAAATGYYMELYRFSLPFGYCMIVIMDIVLYKFAIVITNRGQRALVPVIIIGIVLGIILMLPWNWWGIPSQDIVGQLSIRLYSTLGLIAFSYTVYLTIARVCHLAMKDAKDPVAHAGLRLMFWSMICMVLFFLMLVLDTVLIVAFDHPGYSEFVYVAWIFALVFYVLMYLAVVMPEGFVKLLRK
ncbi:MAG: hypothetical protein GYA24_18265 [Candidatus Lokiarchaeota archaeon]|nr:hypothetical protein [Candidatus Lokiarchaeota archaeon]